MATSTAAMNQIYDKLKGMMPIAAMKLVSKLIENQIPDLTEYQKVIDSMTIVPMKLEVQKSIINLQDRGKADVSNRVRKLTEEQINRNSEIDKARESREKREEDRKKKREEERQQSQALLNERKQKLAEDLKKKKSELVGNMKNLFKVKLDEVLSKFYEISRLAANVYRSSQDLVEIFITSLPAAIGICATPLGPGTTFQATSIKVFITSAMEKSATILVEVSALENAIMSLGLDKYSNIPDISRMLTVLNSITTTAKSICSIVGSTSLERISNAALDKMIDGVLTSIDMIPTIGSGKKIEVAKVDENGNGIYDSSGNLVMETEGFDSSEVMKQINDAMPVTGNSGNQEFLDRVEEDVENSEEGVKAWDCKNFIYNETLTIKEYSEESYQEIKVLVSELFNNFTSDLKELVISDKAGKKYSPEETISIDGVTVYMNSIRFQESPEYSFKCYMRGNDIIVQLPIIYTYSVVGGMLGGESSILEKHSHFDYIIKDTKPDVTLCYNSYRLTSPGSSDISFDLESIESEARDSFNSLMNSLDNTATPAGISISTKKIFITENYKVLAIFLEKTEKQALIDSTGNIIYNQRGLPEYSTRVSYETIYLSDTLELSSDYQYNSDDFTGYTIMNVNPVINNKKILTCKNKCDFCKLYMGE